MPSQNVFRDDTFEHALENRGWVYCAHGRAWQFETGTGAAQLRCLHGRGTWRHFELSGGALPAVKNHTVLSTNGHLKGPVKFVTMEHNYAGCRLDLPESVAPGRDFFCHTLDSIEQPFEVLVRAVGVVIDNREARLPSEHRSAELTSTLLSDAGYSVSIDGEQVQVHVNHGGLYRQIHADQNGLSTEIANLEGYGPSSRKAALLLVHQANERLPLVRFSWKENGPAIVFAEICWGLSPISSTWLPLSIECIDAAIALTARELEAVRDPQLAKLVVANSAA